jgi:hypothetical protein
LRGGIRRPTIEEGLRVIEVWEQRLAASGSPELLLIADNLATLRVLLLSGDFDPTAVGEILVTLGEQLQAVAASDLGVPVSNRLSLLARLLTDQGKALMNP